MAETKLHKLHHVLPLRQRVTSATSAWVLIAPPDISRTTRMRRKSCRSSRFRLPNRKKTRSCGPYPAHGHRAGACATPSLARIPSPYSQVKKLPGGKTKKKEKPRVVLTRSTRNKRKAITTINGLDMFNIKLSVGPKRWPWPSGPLLAARCTANYALATSAGRGEEVRQAVCMRCVGRQRCIQQGGDRRAGK